MAKIRTYSEMLTYVTFEDRFEYLKLSGYVGEVTFGFDRYVNQMFYRSRQWRNVRRDVILRDNSCDLGVVGFEIYDQIMVHHINPMLPEDIIDNEEWVLNPEYLITTTKITHNAIHYSGLPPRKEFTSRQPGDTKLW